MLKRLLIFGSVCSHVAISAIQMPPPIIHNFNARQMQSADTHILYAALRNAQQRYKAMPRTVTENPGSFFEQKIRLFYGINDLINATRPALYNEGLVASISHVSQPHSMIIVHLAHPQSGQFIESEMVVPQHRHNPTPTQAQYNVAEANAYATLVGLECPLENIEGAQASTESGEAQS